jgi:hypothetical protein
MMILSASKELPYYFSFYDRIQEEEKEFRKSLVHKGVYYTFSSYSDLPSYVIKGDHIYKKEVSFTHAPINPQCLLNSLGMVINVENQAAVNYVDLPSVNYRTLTPDNAEYTTNHIPQIGYIYPEGELVSLNGRYSFRKKRFYGSLEFKG